MKTRFFAPAHALLAALAIATGPVSAQQKLVPAQSEISFTSRQMGVPVDGKFKKFDATIAFDPKKPEAGNIAFSIDLTSAQIGDSETMAELAKPGWFDSKRVPMATFQSTAVKAAGPGKFDVTGKLNIKGNVRDVVVPVTLTQAAGATTATGAFVVKRLEFKIGEGDWADTSMVANDVQVKFKLALTGVAAL
ncbi:MAG: polyisoprenoid-binding protein [Methylibium sp. NZG]|nr:MAG: polyisoprenoid-binding protein [Methylibium sp. NZG]